MLRYRRLHTRISRCESDVKKIERKSTIFLWHKYRWYVLLFYTSAKKHLNVIVLHVGTNATVQYLQKLKDYRITRGSNYYFEDSLKELMKSEPKCYRVCYSTVKTIKRKVRWVTQTKKKSILATSACILIKMVLHNLLETSLLVFESYKK